LAPGFLVSRSRILLSTQVFPESNESSTRSTGVPLVWLPTA
jgi:hypothetical protein